MTDTTAPDLDALAAKYGLSDTPPPEPDLEALAKKYGLSDGPPVRPDIETLAKKYGLSDGPPVPDAAASSSASALSKASASMSHATEQPGYMGIPHGATFDSATFDPMPVVRAAIPRIYNLVSATGKMLADNPELGGSLGGPHPTSEDRQQFSQGAQTPLVPLSEGFSPGLMKGFAKGAEGLTSATNGLIMAATGGLGTFANASKIGGEAVLANLLHTGLGAYFAYQMGKGALESGSSAYQKFKAGDDMGALEDAGQGTVQAVLSLLGLRYGWKNASDIGKIPIRVDRTYGGIPPSAQITGEAPFEPPVDTKVGPYNREPQPGEPPTTTTEPPPGEPPTPQEHVNQAEVEKFRQAGQILQPPPEEPATAAIRSKEPNEPTEPQPEPEPASAAGRGGTGSGSAGVPEPAVPSQGQEPARPTAGETTTVTVPGEQHELPVRYEVRPLAELQPSHNGLTFLPNPVYPHQNERNYSDEVNQQRILDQSDEAKFNPRYLITDNPDATNGPPVVDEGGNVLGGNSRTMTLQRVFDRDGDAAQRYRDLLNQKAQQYGIDPASFAGMENPVLVRAARNADLDALPGGSQWAIRKTNVTGTATLSPSERASADAGQLTPDLKEEVVKTIEQAGTDATLAEALQGTKGTALVNKLINGGFFSESERNTLMTKAGVILPPARERISKALLGGYFRDSAQLQGFPAALSQKLERIGPALATVADNKDWDLLPHVRQAVDLIEYARAHDIKNLRDVTAQQGLFGEGGTAYPEKALRIAELLQKAKPNDFVGAFRRYAKSQEPTMFGESTHDQAFDDAFGDDGTLFAGGEKGEAAESLRTWGRQPDPDDVRRRAGFFSQLEKVALDKVPEKVSGAQAEAILRNPQNGVKADELKWTAVLDWLHKQEGKIDKQDLLDYLHANAIQIHERWSKNRAYRSYVMPGPIEADSYGELLLLLQKVGSPHEYARHEFIERMEQKYGKDWLDVLRDGDMTPAENKEDDDGRDAAKRETWQTAPEFSPPHFTGEAKNLLAHTRVTIRRTADGKLMVMVEEIQSDWHQKGRDKGYRDNRLPKDGSVIWNAETGEGTVFDMNEGTGRPFHATAETLAREVGPEYAKRLKEEHLGSITIDQRKLVSDAPLSKTWHEFVLRRLLRYAAEMGYDRIGWTTGAQQAKRYDLAQHVSAVGWDPETTGLWVRRPSIQYENEERGGGWSVAEDAVPQERLAEFVGKEAAQKILASEKRPIDVYGADRRELHMIEGDDLQVGGHGMNSFYDQILPSYAAKYGKKWGATVGTSLIDASDQLDRTFHYEGPEYSKEKVEEALEISRRGGGDIHTSPFTGRETFFVFNRVDMARTLKQVLERMEAGQPFATAVNNTEASGMLADELGGKSVEDEKPEKPAKMQSVHSMDITPAMRESVLEEGQPLFALRKNPRLAGDNPAAGQLYPKNKPDVFHADRARFEVAPIEGKDADVADALVTNLNGLELAARVIGRPPDQTPLSTDALTFEPTERRLGVLVRNLQAVVARFGPVSRAIKELLKRAEAAYAADKSLLLIVDDPDAPADPTAFTEEVDHAVQHRETGDLSNHLRASANEFVSTPEGQIAKPFLEAENHYKFKTDGHAASELGVRLMRGDYEALGLTKPQFVKFAADYVRLLKKDYGEDGTPRIIEKVRESVRELAPGTGGSVGTPTENTPPQSGGPLAAQRRNPRLSDDDAERQNSLGTSKGQESLFGAASDETVAKESASDRDQLAGERLTAQLNAPLTREEQLKKLKRSKENPQENLFEEKEEPAQGSFFLGSGLGAMQPYVAKFFEQDIAPNVKQAAEICKVFHDDLQRILNPAARVGAADTALNVRKNAAQLQRSTDRAAAALAVAKKFFDGQPQAGNYDFIDRVEAGQPQATKELQAIADVMRQILDTRRTAIQALGTGKLQSFIENYFPHCWKDPKRAQTAFENWGKRPMEGSKAFLKKRSLETFADGIAAGLEPLSDNPVDLVLGKAREMDKYLYAHLILAAEKQRGTLQFVKAQDAGKVPKSWKKIDDPVATVYGPSEIPVGEAVNKGIWDGLAKVLDALNLSHLRKMKLPGNAYGVAYKNTNKLSTKFASDEQTLAHEIGHHIEWQFPFIKNLMTHPDKPTRKKLKEQLRNLADLRYETAGPNGVSNYFKSYVRNKDEKGAAVVQAYVMARQKFRQVAPDVLGEFEALINRHPQELGGLRNIQGSLEHHPMTGKVDAGGLVTRGYWYAPEPAANILNNYLSPGLRDKFGSVRGYFALSNFLNQSQLGFSGFHAVFTTLEAATSKLALAFYQAAHGDIKAAAKSAALTPIAPFTSFMKGDKMLKEWYKPGSQSALIGQLCDAAVVAGGRAHTETFYRTHIAENMMKAWREGNVLGAMLRAPGAFFELPTKVIMEDLVPKLKMGAFADMAQYELSKLPPNATFEDADRALARAWDSVDNRFGQLVYDNLFWSKITKDLGMMSIRSLGWNVGDIREIGGGAGDTGKFAIEAAKKATGHGGTPEFTHRMAYLPAHWLVHMVVGAIMYYLWHQKIPQHLIDVFFPPDQNGVRRSPPTYVRDEWNWSHDPLHSAANKLNPIISMARHIVEHQADGHHSQPQQVVDLAKYILREMEPIWLQQMTDPHQKHQSTDDKVLPEIGITRAPASVDNHPHH